MTASEQHDGEAQMRAALRLARHELLALVVAEGAGDAGGATMAARCLNAHLAVAHRLLDTIDAAAHTTWTDRLATVRAAATPWLAAQAPSEATAADRARPSSAAERRELRIIADGLALADMDWNELQLPRLSAIGSRLSVIWAQRATLDGSELMRATLRDCQLDDSSVQRVSFWKAALEDTHLDGANLADSTLTGLRATGCYFGSSNLWNTWLDDALFVACELPNAALGSTSFRGALGAQFLSCDLRHSDWTGRRLVGVTFDECRVFGSRGDASAAAEAEFLRPDFSPNGDGSQIGTRQDVIAMWRAAEATRHRI